MARLIVRVERVRLTICPRKLIWTLAVALVTSIPLVVPKLELHEGKIPMGMESNQESCTTLSLWVSSDLGRVATAGADREACVHDGCGGGVCAAACVTERVLDARESRSSGEEKWRGA